MGSLAPTAAHAVRVQGLQIGALRPPADAWILGYMVDTIGYCIHVVGYL